MHVRPDPNIGDIEFLAKPFVKKELAYAVRNALDRGPQ